ncbi:MAG: hypothetical protein AAFO06_14190 [Cyanobacteria bacterium J06597_16]
MTIRFRGIALGGLLSVVGAMATIALFTPAASAQERILEAVENISENRSGDYYTHLRPLSKIGFITGLGGFADQRVNADAAALAEAYRELMVLQTQNTATVRVPDLPNPYTSSVQLLPASQVNSRVIGSELNFEPLPRR